jgi:hypothetical protein
MRLVKNKRLNTSIRQPTFSRYKPMPAGCYMRSETGACIGRYRARPIRWVGRIGRYRTGRYAPPRATIR